MEPNSRSKERKKEKELEKPPARTRARARGGHLVTTHVRADTCRLCDEPILIGLSEGLVTRVDPYPVDLHGELTALLHGRWSYLLINGYPYRREGSTRTGRVHVDHRCGEPLAGPSSSTPLTLKNDSQDQIPF